MLAWPDLTEVHDRLDVLQIPDMLTVRSLGFNFFLPSLRKALHLFRTQNPKRESKISSLKSIASIFPRQEQFCVSLSALGCLVQYPGLKQDPSFSCSAASSPGLSTLLLK